MRKSSTTTLCIILLMLSTNVLGQNKEQKKIIEAIQQQYQEVVRWVEESQMSDETNNSMQIDIRQVKSDHSTRVKRYEFYYHPDTWDLYFVRLSYNKGRQRFNEEYMFDKEKHDLVYASLKHDLPGEDNRAEFRCYFCNIKRSKYTKTDIRSVTGKMLKSYDTDEGQKWSQQSQDNAQNIQTLFHILINGH